MVTLDEALKTANDAVLLATYTISVLISEMHKKLIYLPHNNVKEIKNPELIKKNYLKLGCTQGWFCASLFHPSSRNIAQLTKVKIMKQNGQWEDLRIPRSGWGTLHVGKEYKWAAWSPARGSHGSPLGKMAAVSQLNRRKSWGYSGSLPSQESSSSQHWQGHFTDGFCSSQADGNSQVLGGQQHQSNSNASSWNQQRGGSGIAGGYSSIQNMPGPFTHGSNMPFSQTTRAAHEKPDASLSLANPGDWDPNYR